MAQLTATRHAKPSGRLYSEAAIWCTAAAGTAVLVPALLLQASLAGVIGFVVVFLACAMSEENYHRGAYRVKPPGYWDE